MPSPSPPTAEVTQDDQSLVVRGRLDASGTAQVWLPLMELVERAPGTDVVLDASQVEYCDGAGAALLVEAQQRCSRAGRAFSLRGLAAEFVELLQLIEPAAANEEPAPHRDGFFERIGAAGLGVLADLRTLLAYTGELSLGLLAVLRNPRRLRGGDVSLIADRAGIGAIPIMAGIGFLLGLILAFQSAIPMRRFGAEIFVADLLGISLMRELGPLMASILLAARSGSAFAAEIGTMKVNEEVDALTTMGLEPMRFLILPRVVAAVLVVPGLAMLVTLAGLAGGAVMFLSLGFPMVTYVNRVIGAVTLVDLVGGTFKAVVFGVIVAAVGCMRGLETGKGAGAVGESTTSSVVSGITLIAITDGIFAVLFYLMGI